ncbi:hypothetical protein NNRS527_02641 [Nitrosospira sp. NRS527]|nr:hypothetical protein NNRS527_02641 [Nitrosospira sp. NRS527]
MKPVNIIKFLEVRENTAESFQPPEQSLDLVTPPVHNLSYSQGSTRLALGGTTGMKPKQIICRK